MIVIKSRYIIANTVYIIHMVWIDFYYIDSEDRSRWFTYIESPYQNKLSVYWDKDIEAGVYKLYMVVKDQSDNLITTPSIIVNIE